MGAARNRARDRGSGVRARSGARRCSGPTRGRGSRRARCTARRTSCICCSRRSCPAPSSRRRSPSFYHPLTALSYVLNVSLFGLNPVAYYATNLLLHLIAVGALYTLARGLGLAVLGGGGHRARLRPAPDRRGNRAGHPAPPGPGRRRLFHQLDEPARPREPGSPPAAPRLHRRRARALRPRPGRQRDRLRRPALVPFALLCAPRTVPLGDRRLLRRTIAVCACFLAVEIVGFAIRWRVLGGLGGYYGSEANRGNLSGVLEFFLRPYRRRPALADPRRAA